MSTIHQIDTITAELRRKNHTPAQLTTLAREVPLAAASREHNVVGTALERLLREHYTELHETRTTAELADTLAAGTAFYRDRDDRALRDAITAILEHRYPDAPDPIDSYDDTSGLTYGQHAAAVYRQAAEQEVTAP